MKNRTKGIVKMVSAAMLALLGLGGWAQTARADSADTSADQGSTVPGPSNIKGQNQLTGTVSTLDKATSSLSIMDQRGNRTTVQVPQDMKNLDSVKIGDKVSVNYQESVAVGITIPGENLSMKKGAPQPTNPVSATSCSGVTEVAANVVSIDKDKGQLSFRTAGGDVRTVDASAFPAVQERLATLHTGDLIKVSYTQPVATKLTPKKLQQSQQ
jgi:hypothetical protein